MSYINIERKWLLKINVATILPLKSTLPGKFQLFNAILIEVSKCWKIEIYRNIQTFAFQVIWEYSSWACRNGAVQMVFVTPTKSMLAGKFLKVGKVFGCVTGVFIMISELRFVKWVRFFEWNCIVKQLIFFASFVGF